MYCISSGLSYYRGSVYEREVSQNIKFVSHVKCQVTHVMCPVLHLKRHVSLNIFLIYTFYIYFYGQSGRASKWKVCYLQRPTRLVYSIRHPALLNTIPLG